MPGFGIARGFGFGIASRFDSDAQAYINAVGDLPSNYQVVFNSLIVNLKTYSLWTKLKYGYVSPITLDDSNAVIDIKTATTLSGAALKGQDEVGFDRILASPLPTGIHLKAASEYIKTGVIPSIIHTVNDTCIAHGVLDALVSASTFNYGAFVDATNDLQANLRTGTNIIVDNYANAEGAGRNTIALGGSTGEGRWIINRRSATDFEVYLNGVSKGTAANGGGSLPNIEMFIGCRNNAGTAASFKNLILTYHLEFSGLTATERNNLETVLAQYESDLGSLRALTRNLAWDGNSLSQYENWNTIRAALYYAYSSNKKLYRTRNYSIPGNTTAQRLTAYPTGAALQYSASYAQNIYVIWEVRNDIYGGATTAQAKINIDALIDAAQATGFKVVVVCPHLTNYSGNTGRTETQFNLAIDEMVTYLVANAAGAEYVVQITDSDLWVPRANYASDAAYNTAVASKIAGSKYADGTHLTTSGYNSVGAMVNTQALSLIG